jgi:chloride channel 7
MLQDYVDSHITPSTFALLGVAAMLAGVQRSTVSICVILVEGTGQIRVLIPVIITVVVARYVAQFVHQYGIHELGMALKGYPYLEQKEARVYDMIEVGDIMSKPPVTVRPLEMAMKLVKLLENSTRHGFPVVDNNGRFIGLVRRNQIVALLECGIFEDVVENTEESPSSTGERKTPRWAPQPGVHKSVGSCFYCPCLEQYMPQHTLNSPYAIIYSH